MDSVPISGLDELHKHLDDLIQDPNLAVTPKLFDDVELQLTESNIHPLIPTLLPKLIQILKQYTDDPAVVVSLTIKLLRPISFTQVLQLASEESLNQALTSPAPAAQILGLTILHKAAASPTDAAILSVMPSVVTSILTAWLSSPKVEVAEKAAKVLGDLLDIDCPHPPPPPPPPPQTISSRNTLSYHELFLRRVPGKGELWKLIFQQPSTYNLLLDLISGRHPSTSNSVSQLTLAQGRILRTLPRLATLNIDAIAKSDILAPTPIHLTNGHVADEDSDTERNGTSGNANTQNENAGTSPPQPGEGLLQYAALRMIDKRDILMHLNLVGFFEAFVSLMRITEYSARKEEIVRALLREAVPNDDMLRDALEILPSRTVQEEAEGLRRWLRGVMPEVTEVPLR